MRPVAGVFRAFGHFRDFAGELGEVSWLWALVLGRSLWREQQKSVLRLTLAVARGDADRKRVKGVSHLCGNAHSLFT